MHLKLYKHTKINTRVNAKKQKNPKQKRNCTHISKQILRKTHLSLKFFKKKLTRDTLQTHTKQKKKLTKKFKKNGYQKKTKLLR